MSESWLRRFGQGILTFACCFWFSIGIPALIILAGWGLYTLMDWLAK